MQMILKLEAEEDAFDGLLVEVSAELRQNPSNFVRFVEETQAASRPALILSGWGSQEVMRAAREEGIAAVIKPADTGRHRRIPLYIGGDARPELGRPRC